MSAGLLYHGGVPGVLRELHVATFKLTLTMAIFISLCASFSHAQFVTRKGDTTKSLKELKKKKNPQPSPNYPQFYLVNIISDLRRDSEYGGWRLWEEVKNNNPGVCSGLCVGL